MTFNDMYRAMQESMSRLASNPITASTARLPAGPSATVSTGKPGSVPPKVLATYAEKIAPEKIEEEVARAVAESHRIPPIAPIVTTGGAGVWGTTMVPDWSGLALTANSLR